MADISKYGVQELNSHSSKSSENLQSKFSIKQFQIVIKNYIYMPYWPQIFLKLTLKPKQEKSNDLIIICNCNFLENQAIIGGQII